MGATTSSRRSGAVLTVAVSGDIDLSTGPLVSRALDDALAADGVTDVDVDLSAVQFLDSSGIALLLKGRRTADEHARGFRVTGAQGMARQVLELTGVWAHLCGDPGQRP